MNSPVPFEFANFSEACKVASLLRKQAATFQLLASYLTDGAARKFEEQAREAIAVAFRIEAAAREAPSNRWPVNQAALKWLKEAATPPDGSISYLVQLAWWGLEKGGVKVREPLSPSQPWHHEVEQLIAGMLGAKASDVTMWFMSNPELSTEEQMKDLDQKLLDATSPEEAAEIVVQAAYDRMVEASARSPQ